MFSIIRRLENSIFHAAIVNWNWNLSFPSKFIQRNYLTLQDLTLQRFLNKLQLLTNNNQLSFHHWSPSKKLLLSECGRLKLCHGPLLLGPAAKPVFCQKHSVYEIIILLVEIDKFQPSKGWKKIEFFKGFDLIWFGFSMIFHANLTYLWYVWYVCDLWKR